MRAGDGFRPALLLTAGRAIASAFTFLIPVVLARSWSPETFGAYKQLFLVYLTLHTVAQLGMAESLYYFLPHHPTEAGRLVMNSVATLGLLAIGCAALLSFGRGTIAQLLGNETLAAYLPLMGVYIGLMLVAAGLEATLISRQRYGWAAATYVGSDVSRTLLLVAPVLLGAGLSGLLLGAILSGLLRVATVVILLRREFGRSLALDAGLLARQAAYALPFALAVLVEMAQGTLHQYVVSMSFDAATFAVYSIGCLQIPFVELLAGPACNVMMVRMAEARRRGETESLHGHFEDTTRKLALFFFPLFALLVVLAPDLIVFLFTDTYARSAPLFRIWCLSVLLAVFQSDGVLRALAETRFLVLVNLVRLALIAVLLVPLLELFGLAGPVLATLLGWAVAKALMLVRYGKAPSWRGLARIAGAAAVAAVVALGVSEAVAAPAGVRLVVVSAAYGIAYWALLLLTPALTPGEREALYWRFWRPRPCVESPGS